MPRASPEATLASAGGIPLFLFAEGNGEQEKPDWLSYEQVKSALLSPSEGSTLITEPGKLFSMNRHFRSTHTSSTYTASQDHAAMPHCRFRLAVDQQAMPAVQTSQKSQH